MDGRRNVAVVVNDASLFRALVGSGVEPYLLTCGRTNSLRLSRHYAGGAPIADPEAQPEQFVQDLIATGARFEHPPPLFFTHDGVLLLVSAHREALAPCFRLHLPPHELVAALVHKAEFTLLAREYGLPVPASLRADEIIDVDQALAITGLPCVLKPQSRHAGWHGSPLLATLDPNYGKVLRADTRADFERMLAVMRAVSGQFVVQTYVPGGDDRILSYHAYLDDAARPLARFVGQKLRTYPRDSGISSCLEIVSDTEVDVLGTDIAARLALVGPVKMDFKRDSSTGRLYLLEINARCTLWHHLGAAAGVNLSRVGWAYLNGHALPASGPYRTGIRWIAPARDLRAFVRSYRPAGLLTVRDYLASLRAPLIYDLFAWDDPLPAAARVASRLRGRLVGRVRAALSTRALPDGS